MDQPNITGKGIQKLALTRLESSLSLLKSLEPDARPADVKTILEEVLQNCEKNLVQLGTGGNPKILSRTYLCMAQAQLKMASLAGPGNDRKNRIGEITDCCELALAQVAGCDSLRLAFDITTEVMAVLAETLPRSSGVQRQAIEIRLGNSLRQFRETLGMQVKDRLYGADSIFKGQILLEGAREMPVGEDRKILLDNALEQAFYAAGLLDRAGDPEMTLQAQALIQEIQALL
jgi:hypothetical protein